MTEAFDAAATPRLQTGAGLRKMTLPESLTSRHAPELFSELQALRGHAIMIDATAVRKVGTLCLQVLASACRTWQAEGLGFRISGGSEDLSKQWQLFGLPVDEFAECEGR